MGSGEPNPCVGESAPTTGAEGAACNGYRAIVGLEKRVYNDLAIVSFAAFTLRGLIMGLLFIVTSSSAAARKAKAATAAWLIGGTTILIQNQFQAEIFANLVSQGVNSFPASTIIMGPLAAYAVVVSLGSLRDGREVWERASGGVGTF